MIVKKQAILLLLLLLFLLSVYEVSSSCVVTYFLDFFDLSFSDILLVLLVILLLVTFWMSVSTVSSLLCVCISGANGVNLLKVLMPQFKFSACVLYIIFITNATYRFQCIAFINIELVFKLFI